MKDEVMTPETTGSQDATGGPPKTPTVGISLTAVKSSYRRYAPVYDLVFGNFLGRGRKVALSVLNDGRPGRVLEIGVGTGLSLPHYEAGKQVTGIDLSPEMLARARERVAALGLSHVEALEEMDARETTFADGSFDQVVSMYVLSVTPEPHRLLAEMRRLCKPGGDILIVNRFTATKPLRRMVERAAEPFGDAIGFNLRMDWDTLDPLGDLETVNIRPVPGLAGASLVHIRNAPRQQAAAAQ